MQSGSRGLVRIGGISGDRSAPEAHFQVATALPPITLLSITVSGMSLVGLVFLHFMFARPLGYPLTPAPFVLPVLVLGMARPHILFQHIFLFSLALLYPFLVLFLWSLQDSPNMTDFYRTYVLWLFAATSLLLLFCSQLRPATILPRSSLYVSFILVVLFTWVQVMLYLTFNSTILYNPFGPHTYLGAYEVSRFASNYSESFPRGPGLFLEPSFNAFVIISLFVALRFSNSKAILLHLMAIAGVLAASALTGIVSLLFILASWSAAAFARSSLVRRRSTLVVLLAGVLLLLISAPYIAMRISEIFVPGTSGYYRLVGPTAAIYDVLLQSPAGRPFGQIEYTLSAYAIPHGDAFGTSLDNGFYFLIFYFGLGALILFVYLLWQLAVSIRQGRANKAILFAYVLSSFAFSGGLFLPEYLLLVALVVLSYRVAVQRADP